jgi:hypothetical protein
MTVLTVYVYNTCMRRKLTLTIDEAVYEGLHRRIGARRISGFVEDLVRPHVVDLDEDALAAAYQQWAEDEEEVREAIEWSDALLEDTTDEAW